MDNPELEFSRRESSYWRSQVDEILDNIYYQINTFNNNLRPHRFFNGNIVNSRLAQLANQLNDLGWRGDRIPF